MTEPPAATKLVLSPDDDPRDAEFLAYWGRVIDWSDPAAGHWLEHFRLRVGECRKMADEIERVRPVRDLRALDVGCQTGALCAVLGERGAKVTGVDTADWLVEAARLRAKGWGVEGTFSVAKGEALPFEDQSFDLVTFVDVLEHCGDGHACLREIARVLAPGGVAYVLGPNRWAPGWMLRDPHYQMAGASFLSHALGKRYVEWRRGNPGYDVGVFPVGSQVVATLERAGLRVFDGPSQRFARRAHGALGHHTERVRSLVRAWGRVKTDTVPTFVFLAERPIA